MHRDDMILVSVDDHVCEPPDLFENHVSARWKDRAPRMLQRTDGTDVWVYEGQQVPNVGLNAVAGRPPDEYGIEPTALSQLRPGCYDVDARIGDMNVNGVLASICFAVHFRASSVRALQPTADDKELGAGHACSAYNDWHIDVVVREVIPGRFIPLALPP